jgi:hypothetical protein
MISWLSPKTERRTSQIDGRGLFARETIAAGEIVAVKGGSIVDGTGLAALNSEIIPASLQIEDDLYIGPCIAAEVEASMLNLNHSCEPNVGVRGQITFVAVSDIPPGCELTIDYAMVYANQSTPMRCACGTSQCRGRVTGDDWRLPALQRRYASFFSPYIDAHIAALQGERRGDFANEQGSMATFSSFGGAADSRMEPYLACTDIIDWKHPAVIARARALSAGLSDPVLVTRRCFQWVRDEIKHSHDFRLKPVTCTASQVLQEGSGYCYAKSHLLAALLRAHGLPTGFCYQRLSRDGNGASFSLHGLNAVRLPGIGWYRVDARGNRDDVDAQFAPPREQLAFSIRMPGEADLPEVWPNPLPVVIDALRRHSSAGDLWEELPDLPLW